MLKEPSEISPVHEDSCSDNLSYLLQPSNYLMRRRNPIKLPKTPPESPQSNASAQKTLVSSIQRFEKSMVIDYEKWHEGIGYDLEAIKSASPTDLKTIEQILVNHSPRDWRDIEALAQINTALARETIKKAIKDPDPDVRIAVMRSAPKLITNSQRCQSLIKALESAEIFGGLSQTLDCVEKYHPTEVKEALIMGLLTRKGEIATLFAGMLFYINGKADEPFDWNQRPFFLRFNTENREERMQAFLELCKQLNINPKKYLTPKAESENTKN